jgi:aminoglycoside 6'-N-acetyltransferase
MAISPYSFRLVAADDLPRLRRRLRTPEVVRWRGDPRREFELLRADFEEPRMTMRIISFRGRPFAYAQDYDVHAWPQAHLAICRRARGRSARGRSTASSACRR